MQGTKIRTQIWMFWEWFRTFFCAGKLANLSNSAVPFILKYCDSEYIWIYLDLLFFWRVFVFCVCWTFQFLFCFQFLLCLLFLPMLSLNLWFLFLSRFSSPVPYYLPSLYPIHINGYISCAFCYMLIFMSVLVSSCSFFQFWFCNNFLFIPHLSYPHLSTFIVYR